MKKLNLLQNQYPKKRLLNKKLAARIIFLGTFLGALFFSILPSHIAAQTVDIATSTASTATSTSTSTIQFILPTKPFIVPEIKALSAVVYEPISKTILYQKNADEIRPIASLIKVLTAITARDILSMQKYPTQTVILRIINQDSKVDRELKRGEVWTLNEILRFMLTTSSNTAAETIASELIPYSSFISFMNFKARNLGLSTLKTSNASGLPIIKTVFGKTTETASAVGSARDIALLMTTAYQSYPGLIAYGSNYHTSFTSRLGSKIITRSATSTNESLGNIPNIIGGKTGYTTLSGGNLAVIVSTPRNTPVVIVVLGSTVTERFTDAAALASSTAAFFTTE